MEQRSAEWFAARCGKVTASRVYDAIARTKAGKYTATRATYMADLVAERLTGVTTARYVNGAMQWGTDHEADCIAAFEFFTDLPVEPVGFVDHPTIPMAGASPDGLINDDGMIEAKCPNTATHIATLLGNDPDDRYLYQTQWQMACTGRQWVKLTSYDPRLPVTMQLHIVHIERDDALIAEMETEVRKFNAEINVIVNELRSRYEEAA